MSDVVREALEYIEQQYQRGPCFEDPKAAGEYFCLRLGLHDQEVFLCAFLDTRHQLIACEEMFRGTINGCHVYVREVVRFALKVNAGAVICAHNHPSGIPEPSQADISITRRLKEALALMDIRLLDHFICGGSKHTSLAERGLM